MRLRLTYILSIISLILIFMSCGKSAGSLDYGFGYIYMPQSIQSGTSGILYNVPSGMDSATYNYTIDTPGNKLNIVLGVLRSGKMQNDAYSVSIGTNADTVNAAIANGSLSDAGDVVLLPGAAYTLPSSVSVPSGQYQSTFYLSVDISQLKMLSGKKAALAVNISNPTKYQLDSTNTETIVLIDVDALHLP